MSKPKCKLVGENGNIFNLMGIVVRVLKENGQEANSVEMQMRIMNYAKSYSEALAIISEYVEVY